MREKVSDDLILAIKTTAFLKKNYILDYKETTDQDGQITWRKLSFVSCHWFSSTHLFVGLFCLQYILSSIS